MGWGKLGSTTATGTVNSLDSPTYTGNVSQQIFYHDFAGTGGNMESLKFNDSGSATVYAFRGSRNGGGDSTPANQNNIQTNDSAFGESFAVIYVCAVVGEDKLVIGREYDGNTTVGAPYINRHNFVGKFVPSSDAPITKVALDSVDGNRTYVVDSNISILGNGFTEVQPPNNVQDNSIFVEKDTAKRYWSSGYFPSATVTRSDDFSSDGWTDNDSTYIGVSGGSMNWNAKRDGSNDASVYDLTSTSANWILRFKLTVTNVSSSTQAGNGFYVGLSDSIQTAGQSTSQDFIGVSIYNDNTDTYRTIDADGSALPAIYQGDSYQATTYNTGSIWYYEIIKTGSSYTVEAFSGSDYSTGSEGKITGSSDATGLRYLKVLNDMASIPTSTNPFQGTINALKFYDGVTNVGSPATWTWDKQPDTRGLFMGGYASSSVNTVDYITILTLGNATDFGDLITSTYDLGGCSSETRAVYGAGNNGNNSNVIGYFTISTPSNATDFGDLTQARSENTPAVSNRTRGVWGGGYIGGGTNVNTMDYITIATPSNATDFGDLATAKRALGGSGNSGTRGLFAGGYSSSQQSAIDYITIATPSNTTTFGSLTSTRSHLNGCSNTTRTLFAGGGSYGNIIDYVTNDTTGNATDFGDLLGTTDSVGALANSTRAVFGGGSVSGTNTNVIQYVTIDTTGNSTDFGDLTQARYQLAGTSGR